MKLFPKFDGYDCDSSLLQRRCDASEEEKVNIFSTFVTSHKPWFLDTNPQVTHGDLHHVALLR